MTSETMTREQHLEWCKQRAREYLDQGDLGQAYASMMSDMGKHPETAPAAQMMAMIGLLDVQSGDREKVRSFIEGFR